MTFKLLNSKITAAHQSESGKLCNITVSENYTSTSGEGYEYTHYLKCFDTTLFPGLIKCVGKEKRFVIEGSIKKKKIESRKAKTTEGEAFEYISNEYIIRSIGKSTRTVTPPTPSSTTKNSQSKGEIDFTDIFDD